MDQVASHEDAGLICQLQLGKKLDLFKEAITLRWEVEILCSPSPSK